MRTKLGSVNCEMLCPADDPGLLVSGTLVKESAPRATRRYSRESGAESLFAARLGFGSLFRSILRRCVSFERDQKPGGDAGDFIDCGEKRGFVSFRGPGEAADLSYELKGSSPDLIVGNGRIEVKKSLNVSAHFPAQQALGNVKDGTKRNRCCGPVHQTRERRCAARHICCIVRSDVQRPGPYRLWSIQAATP
jgi:hypothetical protein